MVASLAELQTSPWRVKLAQEGAGTWCEALSSAKHSVMTVMAAWFRAGAWPQPEEEAGVRDPWPDSAPRGGTPEIEASENP